MARKKSIKRSASDFLDRCDEIVAFLDETSRPLSVQHYSWAHEYAIIRLYRGFENLMLQALVGAVNNDTSTVSTRTGVAFPKHLTDEVCEYLIVGTGYFDFKGRDGLVKKLKEYVPADHYLPGIVKKPKYRDALEKLSAFRNYAAHGSAVSKRTAKAAAGAQRLPSAGAWLKKQNRLRKIVARLRDLAGEIDGQAPY